jgi:hypothetical protein
MSASGGGHGRLSASPHTAIVVVKERGVTAETMAGPSGQEATRRLMVSGMARSRSSTASE